MEERGFRSWKFGFSLRLSRAFRKGYVALFTERWIIMGTSFVLTHLELASQNSEIFMLFVLGEAISSIYLPI